MTMSSRIAVALFLSVLFVPVASSSPASSGQAGAHAAAPRLVRIDDVKAYLDRTRDVIALARSGGYGPIKTSDLDRAVAAQAQIEMLLGNRSDANGLTGDQKRELANAQETINSIVRADDKNRIVCTRALRTGSRLPTRECMTVAQREARAASARKATDELQRSLGCERDHASGQCL
ncbi:MAG: hypothetical protein OQK79_04875 [Rhodanobacter sp.]|jgi:hypothetical protein|nr:hypothetical protein [Rhodanobacter sp.]